MSVWTIVVAAGSGTRFGGAKQFEFLGGERVIDRSISTAKDASDGVVVVVSAEGMLTEAALEVNAVVLGGATRSESVRAGLSAIPETASIIVVHDAARPLASKDLYDAVIDAVKSGVEAAIPGVSLSDTIKKVTADGFVAQTIERSQLVAVQTPQAFDAAALRKAHAGTDEATDDAGLIEAAGGRVRVVNGEPMNSKITERRDLALMEATHR